MAVEEPSRANKSEPAAAEGAEEKGFANLQHYVPQDLLDVSFPAAVRGYDKRAVEAYVKRVNRVIAELKVRSSPPAAADERLKRLEDELRSRQEEGDARMHRLQSDTEAVWNERHDLLEDVRRMSDSLVELANAAAGRIKREEGAEDEEEPTRVIPPTASDESESVGNTEDQR